MLLEAHDACSLRAAFGEYGRSVPARQQRSHEHREAWCLRRYLLTLMESGRLSFPLKILKCETPDYKIEGAASFGIEVTEATSPCDQREMSRTEEQGGLLGNCGGRGGDGWVGVEPELAVIGDLEESLGRKLSKDWKFTPVRLLIYPNSNASLVACWGEIATILRREIDKQRFENVRGKFSEVSIIAGDELWFDVLGVFTRLSLVES